MADGAGGAPAPAGAASGGETVGEAAALFLGNILYAIERCALSLEGEGKREDAAFYRGIARRLAEARGRERGAAPPGPGPGVV